MGAAATYFLRGCPVACIGFQFQNRAWLLKKRVLIGRYVNLEGCRFDFANRWMSARSLNMAWCLNSMDRMWWAARIVRIITWPQFRVYTRSSCTDIFTHGHEVGRENEEKKNRHLRKLSLFASFIISQHLLTPMVAAYEPGNIFKVKHFAWLYLVQGIYIGLGIIQISNLRGLPVTMLAYRKGTLKIRWHGIMSETCRRRGVKIC